ncbi:radical SAM protein [Paenibacillus elgii]|uniref:radical SAM protein n=1 Tax=Paenibacillus elgii TaxID=189691 RepID=UPI0013D62725|nr:radical SAM protein [Paenibacillus elgii]
MLRFYPIMIRTFDDLPGNTSLVIHSLAGCNLHCFGCHNYDELVAPEHEHYLLAGDILQQIKMNGYLFDALIFSGGEFLMGNLKEITLFLTDLKRGFLGKIIINTNGTFPEKIRHLLERELVDGIHIDMKMPYHAFDRNVDMAAYQAVLGVVPTPALVQNMMSAIQLVIRHNSPFSQVRTVKYPVLSEVYFEQIRSYVDELKERYNSEVTYKLNEFYYPA